MKDVVKISAPCWPHAGWSSITGSSQGWRLFLAMAWGKTLNSETVKVVTSGAMKHYHNIMKVVKLTFLFPPLLLHSCPKKSSWHVSCGASRLARAPVLGKRRRFGGGSSLSRVPRACMIENVGNHWNHPVSHLKIKKKWAWSWDSSKSQIFLEKNRWMKAAIVLGFEWHLSVVFPTKGLSPMAKTWCGEYDKFTRLTSYLQNPFPL